MCSFGDTQDICGLPFIFCVYVRVSLPTALSSADTAEQPVGDSLESRANTGPAWQTSHLCVCMGTSGPPRLAGPSVCLPVRLLACTYCCCVLVLSCHPNFHSYTCTGLIYKNKPTQSKAKKPNVKEQPQHHFTIS